MTQKTLREQMAEGHERVMALQEEHQALLKQAERTRMSQRKTRYGDRVAKPHDTAPIKDSLDALYESAAEALDEVSRSSDRAKKVEQAARDRINKRFPGIGGGGSR